MKYFGNFRSIIALILFVTGVSSCTNSVDKDTTTLYFIRHAEKDRTDKINNDPALTEKGYIRSNNWATFFEDKNIDAVYSTDYKRTRETAIPIAKRNNLNIVLYTHKSFLSDNFITKNKGKNIVVVGHSNTVPLLVNKLIGDTKYENIKDEDNNDLFIVIHKNDKTSARRKKVD